MRRLVLVLGLILSGCLVSEQPLIVAGNADWPFPTGTYLNEYDLTGENFERRIDGKTQQPVTGRLSQEDGWYVYRSTEDESKPSRFRLSRIDGKRWLVMFPPLPGGKQPAPYYGLLERRGDFLVSQNFTRDKFHAFRQEMERTRPSEWAQFRNAWRDGAGVVTFRSIDVLKALLPRMTDGGFALTAQPAYRVETDAALIEAWERRRQLRQEMAALDRDRRELCGGRICVMRNKEKIWRTDTLDPNRWYDKTGRLLPQSEWPE